MWWGSWAKWDPFKTRELGQRCGKTAFTTSFHITLKFSPNKSDIWLWCTQHKHQTMAGKNKEAGRAWCAPPSPSQRRWEPKEILLLIFNLVRFWEVVLVFSCWPRHPFCSPPAFLSWLLLGLVVRRKSSWGFLENECWLPFSQLNTRRLTLLKTSTSASGLGQRERGEGKKKARKKALYYISKVQTQTWAFLA